MLADELAVPQVLRAIDIYLRQAYAHTPPAAVRARLDALRALHGADFFSYAGFERNDSVNPSRLALRLGNALYPHMKIVIELAPDGKTTLFRADTHDRHCCPPAGSKEHAAFTELMENNQKIAQAIEAAWAVENIPTFKTFLRDDLARRKAGAIS